MKTVITSGLFLALLCAKIASAQTTPFPTIDSVDINNINAAVLVHGDMWWNPSLLAEKCTFPKGAKTNIALTGSLWMAGYDAGNNLHVAAQTYRQNGNDYWPGPLDSLGTLSYATSQLWAKIWKVNRTQIDSFNAISNHTASNTPAPILQWPAKGNPYAAGNGSVPLTINTDMAPFVDVNNDGVYNPLQGDYPAIKGDQALWWIFSDNGPVHNETHGTPIQAEIHAMAYAYHRGTSIDNVIYYEYNIINKSSSDYTNFRIGKFADLDLGYSFDDFTGFDSTHRMGIEYNGTTVDGYGGGWPSQFVYDSMIPTVAITLLSLPGDLLNNYVPAGSFMYFYNSSYGNGNPKTPYEYNNYLRSTFADSLHLTYRKTGLNTNYAYPGDPEDSTQWSECNDTTIPGDRRFVIASDDFNFQKGSTVKVALALLATNPILHNGCPTTSFDSIKALADTVWAVYNTPLPLLGVTHVPAITQLHIYPNPAHDEVSIDNIAANASIVVYNMIGQVVPVAITHHQNIVQLDVAALPSGIYNVLYQTNETTGTGRFVKD